MSLYTSIFNFQLTPKNFFVSLLTILIVAFLSIFLLVLVIDPINIWHYPQNDRYLTADPRISKQAIARNHKFDSFVVGTSLSEELNIPHMNEILGAEFSDLTMGGSTSYEIMNVINFLPSDKYKYLILEVYFVSYKDEATSTRLSNYPKYLWDTNRINDIYVYTDLLKRKELFPETLNAIKVNFLGYPLSKIVSNKRVIQSNGVSINLQERVWDSEIVATEINKVYAIEYLEKLTLHKSNLPIIFEESSQKFDKVFAYFPPVTAISLKHQLIGVDSSNLERYLDWINWVSTIADEYENVTLINYQDIDDITTDSSNYWDYNHYRKSVSQSITEDAIEIFQSDKLFQDNFGTPGIDNAITLEDLILFEEEVMFGK